MDNSKKDTFPCKERLENGCSMKLTDMNFDCLVSCFRYLSVEELLTVADSSKQLRCAASYVFARLCGRKTVLMNVLKSCWERCNCKSKEKKEILSIYHLKIGLQLLRCFGDLVSGVEVRFQSYHINKIKFMRQRLGQAGIEINYYKQCAKAYEYEHLIIDYINEYCSQSLTNMKFSGNPFGNLNKLTKKFVNIENLKMKTIFATKKKLLELFPKVRQLELQCHYDGILDTRDRNIFIHNDIANHFPYLQHLLIDNWGWNLNYENFATALRLNPQLKSLKGNVWLDVIFNIDEFLDLTEYLQNLESLEVVVKHSPLSAKITGKNIHLINLKELCFSNFIDGEPCPIPFSSDKLESLTICTYYISDLNNIIKKYPTLKKLVIDANHASEINFTRISTTLPLLEEMCLNCDNEWFLTFDEVVLLINSFPFLRLFEFISLHSLETGWARLLNNGWSVLSENKYDGMDKLKIVLERQN